MKRAILFLVVLGLAISRSHAISDPDFDMSGAGWTTYTGGSGAVTFGPSVVTGFTTNVAFLTAIASSQAGLEQAEPLFTTSGQEFQLSITVNNIGNVFAGWEDGSQNVGFNTVYANGVFGTRVIVNDDPTKNYVFAEKTGAVGGAGIEIESMFVSEITAPPTYGIGGVGIISAARQTATSALLTWHQATDNVTSNPQMVYHVYWSTISGNVISDGIQDTFTGVLSGTVSGLPAGQQVFFTVRACDRVGNCEGNTIQANIMATVNGVEGWELYE